ncbi:MAG: hypothetical protein QF410_12540, partial [Planctomycetota bacterium]|nr:hypothetical protein [Planctomycetota bacterium]
MALELSTARFATVEALEAGLDLSRARRSLVRTVGEFNRARLALLRAVGVAGWRRSGQGRPQCDQRREERADR